MKNWFQREWARLFGEHRPLNAAPAAAPEWTEEHAQFLRNFLTHPHGQDLLARARALETKLALDACHKRNSVSPENASGFSDAINWLESLAMISVPTAAQPESDPRQSTDVEEVAMYPSTAN